ncbi:hypothetical protein [Fibrisoma limi]|nr:hypothetical protein [Fibrisoma limi]
MTKPYLIYVIGVEEDTQLLLLRAFSRTAPDCVLYFFSTYDELLEHLTLTQDKPHLILTDGLQSPRSHSSQPIAQARLIPAFVTRVAGYLSQHVREDGPMERCRFLPPLTSCSQAVQFISQLRPLWTRTNLVATAG